MRDTQLHAVVREKEVRNRQRRASKPQCSEYLASTSYEEWIVRGWTANMEIGRKEKAEEQERNKADISREGAVGDFRTFADVNQSGLCMNLICIKHKRCYDLCAPSNSIVPIG